MTTNAIISETSFVNVHQDLIDLCKKGNQKAQFQIYKLYYKAMYNISLRVVNDPMEAEDIMQESFLSAFEKIDSYSGTVSFGAWLKRIVINRSIDAVKKDRRWKAENLDFINETEICHPDNSEPEEDIHLRASEARQAISKLPERKQIITSLYLLEGYDHEEIGEILSISPLTSRSQYSRARQQLIGWLNGKQTFSQLQSL